MCVCVCVCGGGGGGAGATFFLISPQAVTQMFCVLDIPPTPLQKHKKTSAGESIRTFLEDVVNGQDSVLHLLPVGPHVSLHQNVQSILQCYRERGKVNGRVPTS